MLTKNVYRHGQMFPQGTELSTVKNHWESSKFLCEIIFLQPKSNSWAFSVLEDCWWNCLSGFVCLKKKSIFHFCFWGIFSLGVKFFVPVILLDFKDAISLSSTLHFLRDISGNTYHCSVLACLFLWLLLLLVLSSFNMTYRDVVFFLLILLVLAVHLLFWIWGFGAFISFEKV